MAKKVKQETEYGYRTPDGEEHWPFQETDPVRGPHIGHSDMDTEKGQEKVRENYRKVLSTQGIPEKVADELEFIQRVRTITLSKTIPLPPRHAEVDEEAPRHRLSKTPVKSGRPF